MRKAAETEPLHRCCCYCCYYCRQLRHLCSCLSQNSQQPLSLPVQQLLGMKLSLVLEMLTVQLGRLRRSLG